MSRLYALCPNCNFEVFVGRSEWGSVAEIPTQFSGPAHCSKCARNFSVDAENAILVPEDGGE